MTVLLSRLKAEWRLKLALTLVFNFLFWAGYELLGHHAFFPLHKVPLTWLDANVPYQPTPWGWVYLSQFSYTGLVPWLLSTKDGIRRYMIGLCIMTAISFLIFFFFPVAAPRPEETGAALSMRFIAGYDGLLNSLPSLHAGFLCYVGLLAWRLFGRSASPLAIAIALLWGGAVMYATLATKQHYVIDLVAGGILGFISDRVAWRGSSSEIAALTIPRKSGMISQAGSR